MIKALSNVISFILMFFIQSSIAGEQVILLSEPGSGAHAFAVMLTEEAKRKNGDDMMIAWDPCSVVRRHRASISNLKDGIPAIPFSAKECSALVQRILECNITVSSELDTIVTAMRLALVNPLQRELVSNISDFIGSNKLSDARTLYVETCKKSSVRMVKEDPRDLVLSRLRASVGKLPLAIFQQEKMKTLPYSSATSKSTVIAPIANKETTSSSSNDLNRASSTFAQNKQVAPQFIKQTTPQQIPKNNSSEPSTTIQPESPDHLFMNPFVGIIGTEPISNEPNSEGKVSRLLERRQLLTSKDTTTSPTSSKFTTWSEQAVARHARAVCAQQRLTLQGLAPVFRDGRQRGFWVDRKYLPITAESFEIEPQMYLANIVSWMRGNWNKHSQLPYAAKLLSTNKMSKVFKKNSHSLTTRRLLASTNQTAKNRGNFLKSNTKNVVNAFSLPAESYTGEWRYEFDKKSLSLINIECSSVLDALRFPQSRWQSALSNSPSNEPSRRVLRKHKQYPDHALATYSDEKCGNLWLPIHGLGGQGGSTSNCRTMLMGDLSTNKPAPSMSLSICGKLLKESSKCHAATYTPPTKTSSTNMASESLFGSCTLHDRSASSDFVVRPQRGVVHLVRSTSLDACNPSSSSSSSTLSSISSSTEPFRGALKVLEPMAATGFGNMSLSKLKSITGEASEADDRFFYLELDSKYPGFSTWRNLMKCYEVEFHDSKAWSDEDRPDFVQNMAHLYIYESLLHHPLRTFQIDKASLVILPIETVISSKLHRPCFSTTHEQRMKTITQSVARFIEDHRITDHKSFYQGVPPIMVMGTYWATFRDWGGRRPHKKEVQSKLREAALNSSTVLSQETEPELNSRRRLQDNNDKLVAVEEGGRRLSEEIGLQSKTLWSLLAPHAILVTIDEYFSHDWNKVMVAPYLAHADISRSLTTQLVSDSNTKDFDRSFKATHSSSGVEYKDDRTIQLFFRGGVDHGSMCKRRRTPGDEPPSFPAPVSRKRNASEIAAFVNKAGDSEVTWLREAAVDYFRDAPPGVVFVATGDRRVVFRRNLLSTTTSYARSEYVSQLMKSRFCLHLQGDTTTSRRLFDSIAAGCIPVVIADGVNLPFSDKIDWSLFTIMVPEVEVLRGTSNTLEGIMLRKHQPEEIAELQFQLALAKHELLYGVGDPLSTHAFNVYRQHRSDRPSLVKETQSNLDESEFTKKSHEEKLEKQKETFNLHELKLDNNFETESLFHQNRKQKRKHQDFEWSGSTLRTKLLPSRGRTFKSKLVDHLLQEALELGALPAGTRYRRFKPAFSKCIDLVHSL